MQGWGFSGEQKGGLSTNEKIDKKKEAFWEVANENVIVVPDIDAEQEAL